MGVLQLRGEFDDYLAVWEHLSVIIKWTDDCLIHCKFGVVYGYVVNVTLAT